MNVTTRITQQVQRTPAIHASGRGYVVRVNGQVIKCHNLATARYYLRQAQLTRL
tara:strand:- start:148 stop:309 length:162 start_codon:yes stop_codon:yes gene_type:complete